MTDIIKVELFRIKKSVLFWVMLAITAALPILSAVMVASLIGVVGGIGGAVGEPDVGITAWELIRQQGLTTASFQAWAQISSNVAVLAVITSAVVLSGEFNDGTMRNVVLANKTRTEMYFGYLIVSLIMALSFLAANFATTMIVVAPIFGFGGMDAGQAVSACLTSLAMGILAILFMESCMCMFLFATRKQWITILIPLVICMAVPGVLTFLISLIVATMAVKGQNVSLTEVLRWVPFSGISLYNPANIDGVTVGMNILYMALFTAMFVVIGYFAFRKADLK